MGSPVILSLAPQLPGLQNTVRETSPGQAQEHLRQAVDHLLESAQGFLDIDDFSTAEICLKQARETFQALPSVPEELQRKLQVIEGRISYRGKSPNEEQRSIL